MSTTVTYKGSTLTTVDNQTRTLLTAGKYMEDDLTLVDVSGGGGTDYLEKRMTNAEVLEYSNSDITSVAAHSCRGWSNLKGIDLPNITSLGDNAFYGTGITRLFLPEITSISGAAVFRACTSLKSVVFKKSVSVTGTAQTFYGCTALESFDTNGGRIGGNDFNGSTALKTIVVRGSSVITLAATNALDNTPFKSGGTGGTLYVPNDLISSYQSASNWSTILGYANNSIKSIESTHTDPNAPIDLTLYYADGTPISA